MSKGLDKYIRRGVRTSYTSSVIGISLVLFMIGLVIGGAFEIRDFEKQTKESIQADIFFNAELNESDIKMIEIEIKQWPEFNEVYFMSPERALEVLENSGGPSREDVMGVFDDEDFTNPIPPTVVFKPKEKFATKKGMEHIKAKLLESFEGKIQEVSYDENTMKTVNQGLTQLSYILLTVAILLVLIAVAMINTTIRLSLYSKRFTIKTMQLVGATGFFISRPYILYAALQGLIATIIGMFLLVLVFYASNNFLDTYEISLSLTSFWMLFLSLLVLGIFITVLSTWFALNKYLRMSLDDLYS